MRNPLVSVVITTFNQVSYIGKTIESVRAQTFRDYEIVVVDDGSTDSTPAILRLLDKDTRIIRQANTGIAGARNTGVLHARGK
jgi:glycosyltransferase involved in cell wall biosynthesis